MKYYKYKEEAELFAEYYTHLIGQYFPEPYQNLDITAITVEKSKFHQGYEVILSHDIFESGNPELTGYKCPTIELNAYLKIMASKKSKTPNFSKTALNAPKIA
jgi:hypothetical protein